MTQPITPSDVSGLKQGLIPDEVFATFNRLITAAWNGSQAVIKQEVVAKAVAEAKGVSTSTVFDNHWLDIEESYRAAGWQVEYDKPAYCETYDATFTFRMKKAD